MGNNTVYLKSSIWYVHIMGYNPVKRRKKKKRERWMDFAVILSARSKTQVFNYNMICVNFKGRKS